MDVEEFSAEALADRLREIPAGSGDDGTMTLKERFRRTMNYQEVAVGPNFEFGYWEGTLKAWHEQGLPDHVKDEKTAYEYFGVENWAMVPVNPGPTPLIEGEDLEVTEDRWVYRDSMGWVAEINVKGDRSIPRFIEFPVKDRASWEPYKATLDPDDPRRYLELEKTLPKLRNSDVPVGIGGGSMVGIPRNLIGFERIAVMPYEDPDLFRDIVDTFGECAVAVLERVLPLIEVDFCMGWEDICFNQGPIINPDTYREVVGPWYRRIADLLVAHGCCVYTTDCDGDVLPLVDVFLDHGMNTLFPAEVNAGTDPCLARDRYGKHLRLWGGFDKMVLTKGPKAIDAELDRLRPYVEQGAFICGVDHRVQADVPLVHYLHYRGRKREVLGVGGDPKY